MAYTKNRTLMSRQAVVRTVAPLAAALVASAGFASSVTQTGGKHADTSSAANRESIMASFSMNDDGAPGKSLPPEPVREMADLAWERPEPKITDDLKNAVLPAHYMYNGEAVRMVIDGERIAVRFIAAPGAKPDAEAGEGGGANALVAGAADDRLLTLARALGLNATKVWSPGVGDWRFIHLAQPLADAGAVNAVLELLLTDPSIAFASPIYHNPSVQGGFVVITPELNVRVIHPLAGAAAVVVSEACPGMEIVQAPIGGIRGSAQVRSTQRNGFAALREANTLALDPRFAWAEPDKVATMELHYTPNDAFGNDQGMWGWKNTGAGGGLVDFDTDAYSAFDLTRGNPAIRVLVMDTGTQQNHPDINQLAGRDFTNGTSGGSAGGGPVGSCDDHGTPVAGIISGRIDNSIGGMGVAPNVRVIGTRIASQETNPCSSSFASFSTSWVANALDWGVGQGCRITNSSFGCSVSSTLTSAYLVATGNGVLNFASSGNGGSDSIGDGTLGYPSSIASNVAIGALQRNGTKTTFSNWGTGIDFVAPGSAVLGTDRTGGAGYSSSDYTYFGGTSAASPFAAGIAALIWSAFPFKTAAEVHAMMVTASRDMGDSGYDNVYGHGFPNVNSALRAQQPWYMWCATPRIISGSTLTQTGVQTQNASSPIDEPQESCESGGVGVSHSIWYKFDPPCLGTISINTNGSNYDTVLSVFRGSCESAVQVVCDDDGGTGLQSQVTDVIVSPTFTYYIKVAAYGVNNAGGSMNINFVYTATPPANDMCSDATAITVTPWTSSRCTVGATNQVCESNETCELNNVGTSRSVWWQYTPAVNGKADIDTVGSGYDTVLSVWTGCPLGLLFNGNITCLTGTQLACNDDGGPGTTSMLSGVPMRKGTTYRIKASAYGPSGNGGDLTLHFNYRPCPADYNASGAVTVQDIFDFLADYFSNAAAADINSSGAITVQDIFDYLSLYFGADCA